MFSSDLRFVYLTAPSCSPLNCCCVCDDTRTFFFNGLSFHQGKGGKGDMGGMMGGWGAMAGGMGGAWGQGATPPTCYAAGCFHSHHGAVVVTGFCSISVLVPSSDRCLFSVYKTN